MTGSLDARLRRLEGAAGGGPGVCALLFLPEGVEAASPEADRLIAEHRERTRCAVVVALSSSDAAL
jgi:hypothetical protein